MDLTLIPRNIRNGEYQMWLPVSSGNNQETRFLEPDKEFTLTIPSTAKNVISAGAYDVRYQSYADFSGRGDQRYGVKKPDLVAPGVGIWQQHREAVKTACLGLRWQLHLSQDRQLF